MIKLDKATADKLSPAMHCCWQEIGGETEALYQEIGKRMTNAGAIEMCIDADRLETNGRDPQANKLLGELFKEHGYKKVNSFLCKHFKFA